MVGRRITRSEEIPESGTVTVCCNIANGLDLKLYDFDEQPVNVLGGGTRMERIAHLRDDTVVKLFGPARAKGADAKCLVVGGYAITTQIDAQFMKEWFEQNKLAPYVKNECVYVLADEASARDWAKEHKGNRSGMEPLSADGNDPRIPRRGRFPISRDTQAPPGGGQNI